MSNDIEGKTVVITGASSGLGAANARLLSAECASVVSGARPADCIESFAQGVLFAMSPPDGMDVNELSSPATHQEL